MALAYLLIYQNAIRVFLCFFVFFCCVKDWTLNAFRKDLWSKKKCFMPIIANIFDQSSDIGFMFGMGQLMTQEMINDKDCPNINATYLFALSLFFFLFYRVISGVMVFIATRNIWYALGQFSFEYMLYRAVWVNYVMKCKDPCSPQRWLQNMEAMLEAFPQLIIQMFFFIKSDEFEGFVILSIVFSMISMINKAVSEDKQLFIKKIDQVSGDVTDNWQDAKWNLHRFPFVNLKYLIRALFRMFDISHRSLMIVLVWTELGGIYVVIFAAVEVGLLSAVVIKTKELSVLFTFFILVVTL